MDEEELNDRIADLEFEMLEYIYALKAAGCAYAHNEKHGAFCVCADCKGTAANCDCLRCAALHNHDIEDRML